MKRILLLFALAAVLFSCKQKDDKGYIVHVGETAPDFELYVNDSTSMKLSDLRGKVVMLQFTATWCSVCLREMPYIQNDIWERYLYDEDFALYGVMYKQGFKDVPKMRELTEVTYPLAVDPDGSAFHFYAKQGAGVTRNVIIDRDGKIIFLTRLFDDKEFKEMVEVIGEELEKDM